MGRCLVLLLLNFVDIHGRLSLVLIEMEEEWIGGSREVGGRYWKEKTEGKLWL